MKKCVFLFSLALLCATAQGTACAQAKIENQPFNGRLKLQAYTEYINFNNVNLNANTLGGGILARYMFTDYIGAQTNFTLYRNVDAKGTNGHLSPENWRLSVFLHTYMPTTAEEHPLYLYAGGGIGYQFNSRIGDITVDDTLTEHVLAGIGYDFPENFHIEVEAGYQFGDADTHNFRDSSIGMEAVFVRLGAGIRI